MPAASEGGRFRDVGFAWRFRVWGVKVYGLGFGGLGFGGLGFRV